MLAAGALDAPDRGGSMLIGFFALALVAAPQQLETMTVRPSTEAQAVAEFEATCIAGFRSLGSLRASAGASPRKYAEDAAATGDGWRNWKSSFGSIHYHEQAAGDQRATPQCNFTSFTASEVNRRALADEIADMAQRQAASDLTESRDHGAVTWSWRDAQERPMSVMVVLDRKTPQQITLALRPLPVGLR
jgi:hypothetical protein